MSFQIVGELRVKNNTAQVTNTFKKRSFVIELKGDYPQYVEFQLTQDRCDALDAYSEGEDIKVSFDLRGREWTNPKGEVKYFNTLNAWKLEKMGAAAQPATAAPVTPAYDPPAVDDDLPF